MKKLLTFMLLIITIGIIVFQKDIRSFVLDNYVAKKEINFQTANQYQSPYIFSFVEKTYDFIAKDKKQLLNIVFTILDNGWNDFSFYCDYKSCSKDLEEYKNSQTFSVLNNFIHPFNSFNQITFSTNFYDKVTIKIGYTYSKEEITKLETEVKRIENEIIKENMNTIDKLKAIHDYIINKTKYDTAYNGTSNKDYQHKASGPLFEGKSLCNGYTDAMALFLTSLKIPNYKIASESHIWNYVYLNNNWYHLDLTWDDPVASDNSDVLLHKFFLIATSDLEKIDTTYHIYNKNVYLEA